MNMRKSIQRDGFSSSAAPSSQRSGSTSRHAAKEHKEAQDAARSQREESHAIHAEQIVEVEARHKAVSASLSALRDEHSQSERARRESDRKAQSLAEDLRAKHRELDAARGDGAAQVEASAAQDAALARAREEADTHFSALADLRERSARELASAQSAHEEAVASQKDEFAEHLAAARSESVAIGRRKESTCGRGTPHSAPSCTSAVQVETRSDDQRSQEPWQRWVESSPRRGRW